jgi:hypothetical protein
MDFLFSIFFWLILGTILIKFGLDELKIFTNIVDYFFEYPTTKWESIMTDAEFLEHKLNNLNLDPETKKMILKESQDNYNYSVEGRRAENSRLLATAAIMISMIAAFYTLLTHVELIKDFFALAYAAISILIFGVSCLVATLYLFRAMSCEYGTPPSTADKILELEKIKTANANGSKLDFENSLTASNAVISYKNVQSNIKKGKCLGIAVMSIKSGFVGLALFVFEIAALKLYHIFL